MTRTFCVLAVFALLTSPQVVKAHKVLQDLKSQCQLEVGQEVGAMVNNDMLVGSVASEVDQEVEDALAVDQKLVDTFNVSIQGPEAPQLQRQHTRTGFQEDYYGPFCGYLKKDVTQTPFQKHFRTGKIFFIDLMMGTMGEAQPDCTLGLAVALRSLADRGPETDKFDVVIVMKPTDVGMFQQFIRDVYKANGNADGDTKTRVQEFFPNLHCYSNNMAQAFYQLEKVQAATAAAVGIGSKGKIALEHLQREFLKHGIWNLQASIQATGDFFRRITAGHTQDQIRLLGFIYMWLTRADKMQASSWNPQRILLNRWLGTNYDLLQDYKASMRFIFKSVNNNYNAIMWYAQLVKEMGGQQQVRFGMSSSLFPLWADEQFNKPAYVTQCRKEGLKTLPCPACRGGTCSAESDEFIRWLRDLTLKPPPKGSNIGSIMFPTYATMSSGTQEFVEWAIAMDQVQETNVRFVLMSFSSMPEADGFRSKMIDELKRKQWTRSYFFLTIGGKDMSTMWPAIFDELPHKFQAGDSESQAFQERAQQSQPQNYYRHSNREPFSVVFQMLTRLKHAVVVFHGGMGTRAEAAQNGLRSVIMSYGMDQPFGGDNIEALGVGKHIPAGEYIDSGPGNEPFILTAIQQLLSSEDRAAYKQRAAEMQRKFMLEMSDDGREVSWDQTKPIRAGVDFVMN